MPCFVLYSLKNLNNMLSFVSKFLFSFAKELLHLEMLLLPPFFGHHLKLLVPAHLSCHYLWGNFLILLVILEKVIVISSTYKVSSNLVPILLLILLQICHTSGK